MHNEALLVNSHHCSDLPLSASVPQIQLCAAPNAVSLISLLITQLPCCKTIVSCLSVNVWDQGIAGYQGWDRLYVRLTPSAYSILFWSRETRATGRGFTTFRDKQTVVLHCDREESSQDFHFWVLVLILGAIKNKFSPSSMWHDFKYVRTRILSFLELWILSLKLNSSSLLLL